MVKQSSSRISIILAILRRDHQRIILRSLKDIGPFIQEEMLLFYHTHIGKISHAPWQQCLFMNHVKSVNLLRGSPNNYFCKVISKSAQWFILNEFSKFFQSVAMATRVLHGFHFF
jgi:hypothetical protein